LSTSEFLTSDSGSHDILFVAQDRQRRSMLFDLEFLGFNSKRKWAIRLLDRILSEVSVNPAYINDGMRYAIYKWVLEDQSTRVACGNPNASSDDYIKQRLWETGKFLSFCVLGPAETESIWDLSTRIKGQDRLESAMQRKNEDSVDAKVLKLALHTEIAATDIRKFVALE